MGGERAQLTVEDVDDGQHVEAGERGTHPIGLREGSDRVAARDQEGPEVALLDLVDHRHRGELAGHPRELGPARRARIGAGPAGARRPEPPERAVEEAHAAGPIE